VVKTVLVVAGTDSSGGAGLIRDVQVLTELGIRVRCVVTAVTAQSNQQVRATQFVSADVVRHQVAAALEDHAVDAIKIGMVGTRENIEALTESLPSSDQVPIVLDPVIAASSGGTLLEPSALNVLRDRLIPLATIVTPNLLESAILLDSEPAADEAMMVLQARQFLKMGARAVLLKGGHGNEVESVDVLSTAEDAEPLRLRAPRVNAVLRGTGCALSSAMAAWLATGAPLAEACERAKGFVWAKLKKAT
jgi:hydroxymethylpyrimidine/phosphomethylpyrimidine kinase